MVSMYPVNSDFPFENLFYVPTYIYILFLFLKFSATLTAGNESDTIGAKCDTKET